MAKKKNRVKHAIRVKIVRILKKIFRNEIIEVLKEIRFLVKPEYESPNLGAMMDEDLKSFLLKICSGRNVLEFGSGGSTLLIGPKSKKMISIESDVKFIKTLKPKMSLQPKIKLIHANIGPTTFYGKPLEITKVLFKRKFKNYTNIKKILLDESNFEPDVILIDGRFRVACFLQCIIEYDTPIIIIFDDYFDRPYYHIIDQLLIFPENRIHNTAVFAIENYKNIPLAKELLKDYTLDYR
jgi:protein O-GlcNAc transferase